jgi:hypothetical protein
VDFGVGVAIKEGFFLAYGWHQQPGQSVAKETALSNQSVFHNTRLRAVSTTAPPGFSI